MAESSTDSPVIETDANYHQKKRNISEQMRKGERVKAEDLYELAALLARWASHESLPLCLCCRTNDSKPSQLGHLIPLSILKTGQQKYFADVIQGKESGTSNMGYRAFCPKCEDRFSEKGEVYLNTEFFKPFFENQDDEARCECVNRDGQLWFYFSILSIVWRCLCFSPEPTKSSNVISALECLRSFLLNYPAQSDIDSKVTLYVFAQNDELESRLNDNETYKRYFNEMYGAKIVADSSGILLVWVFLGPIHILMRYTNLADADAIFGTPELDEKARACIIESTATQFTIPNKKERFFPMVFYDIIIQFLIHILSLTSRIPVSKKFKDAKIPALPAVEPTNLFLLPKSVSYSNSGHFSIPKFYKIKFQYNIENDTIKIVGAYQGNKKVLFVAFDKAIKYTEGDKECCGPLAMALEIEYRNDNEISISYQKDVKNDVEKCGKDFTDDILYREIIEKQAMCCKEKW